MNAHKISFVTSVLLLLGTAFLPAGAWAHPFTLVDGIGGVGLADDAWSVRALGEGMGDDIRGRLPLNGGPSAFLVRPSGIRADRGQDVALASLGMEAGLGLAPSRPGGVARSGHLPGPYSLLLMGAFFVALAGIFRWRPNAGEEIGS